MKKDLEVRIDRAMRTVHLYTGLFLVPWMIIYAVSGFLLNHKVWVAEQFGITFTNWELVKEVDYTEKYDPDTSLDEKGRSLLKFVDLDGPHWIVDGSSSEEFLVSRASGLGEYLVSWLPHQSKIIVEQKKPFSVIQLIHFLHFTHGYDQPYISHIAWALVVDLMVISLLFWMVSGIYIWAVKKRKRLLGGFFLSAGGVIFLVILIIMCQ